MNAHFVIDSIENAVATLELFGGGRRIHVPAAWLPSGSREGDILALHVARNEARSELRFELDAELRREREKRIRDVRDALPRAPQGDIEL